MKNKKMLIMSIAAILVTIVLALFIANPVFALKDPSKFETKDFNNDNANAMVATIIGFIQWVGSAFAIIMIVVLGVKYIAGSAEEKSDYKKSMIPYVVGAILVFAASNIAGAVYDFATKN